MPPSTSGAGAGAGAGARGTLSPVDFVAKWSPVQLPERAASQEHFLDLCRLLGQPTPAEHDATGSEYAFEKSTTVTAAASRGSHGDRGFADVWWSLGESCDMLDRQLPSCRTQKAGNSLLCLRAIRQLTLPDSEDSEPHAP